MECLLNSFKISKKWTRLCDEVSDPVFGFPQVIIYDGNTCEVKKRIARFNDVVCLT